MLLYNCQKYRHIAKECFQKKKPRTLQPGPLAQARKTHQEEESDDEAKEQANVILWQMGEASGRVKGYVARTIGEGFRSACVKGFTPLCLTWAVIDSDGL